MCVRACVRSSCWATAVVLVAAQLPPEFRVLGNPYVRDEFRKHRTATPREIVEFQRMWTQYYDTLRQPSVQLGMNIVRLVSIGACAVRVHMRAIQSANDQSALSAEQQDKMGEMKSILTEEP